MKDCNSCIHQRVCSLKGKYEDYKKEMEALMKKWGDEKENPFGFSMNCPEWHEKINVGITRNDKPKSDLDIWIEQERNMHPPLVKKIKEGEREPRITYDWNDSVDKSINPTNNIGSTKITNNGDATQIHYYDSAEDEIMATNNNIKVDDELLKTAQIEKINTNRITSSYSDGSKYNLPKEGTMSKDSRIEFEELKKALDKAWNRKRMYKNILNV